MKTVLSPLARGLLLAAAAVGTFGCTQPEVQVRPVSSMPGGPVAENDSLYQSAVTAINNRDYARALDYLQAARDKDAKNVKVLNAFGVVYDKLGRFDLSARYYAQASAVEPDSQIVAANMAYSRKLQGIVSGEPQTMLASAAPQDLRAPAPSPLRLTDLPSTSVMPVASLTPLLAPFAPAALPVEAEPEIARAPLLQPLRLTNLPVHSLTRAAALTPMAAPDIAAAAAAEDPRMPVPPPLRLTDQPTLLHAAVLAPIHPGDVVAAAMLDDVRVPVPPPQRLTDLPAGSLLHLAALIPLTPADVAAAEEAQDARMPVPPPQRLIDAAPTGPMRTAVLTPVSPAPVADVAEPEAPRAPVPPPLHLTDHAPASPVRVAVLAPVSPTPIADVAEPEAARAPVPPPQRLTDHAPASPIRTAVLSPVAPAQIDQVAEPENARAPVPPPQRLTDHAPASPIRAAMLAPVTPDHVDDVAPLPKPIAIAAAAPAPKLAVAAKPTATLVQLAAAEVQALAPAMQAPAHLAARLPAVPMSVDPGAASARLIAAAGLREARVVRPRLPAVPFDAVAVHVLAAAHPHAPALQFASLTQPAVPRIAPAVPDTGAPLTPVAYRVEIVNASGRRDGAEPIRRGLTALGWSAPLNRNADSGIREATTLYYPLSGKATAMAWARTLPFRVQLAAGNADTMRLVVGSDFIAWQRKGRHVPDVWRKALTLASLVEPPHPEMQ